MRRPRPPRSTPRPLARPGQLRQGGRARRPPRAGRELAIAVLRALPVGDGPVVALLPALSAALHGDASLAPVPARDARRAALLASTLRVGDPIDDEVALVVSTSGTAGTPKGALLTAAALRASAAATHRRLGGPGAWLLALPADHIAGLQVLLRGLAAGTETTVLDVSDGFDPTVLPAAVAAMPAGRRYTSLVAAQLAKALTHPPAVDALAALDAVLVGGGPLPAPVATAATAAGIAVVRTYGMSETAGGCVYDGRPLDGVEVRVVDGRVVLGGATLAAGYRDPVTPDPFADPGWFRTDDAGALDADGVLSVLGRLDEAVSTGGLTVVPQVVEAALATHPAIVDCAVFGVPDDRLGQRVAVAIVVAIGASAPTAAQLRGHLAGTLDATAAPREVHVVEEIPRRGIGKPDRAALRRRFGAMRP